MPCGKPAAGPGPPMRPALFFSASLFLASAPDGVPDHHAHARHGERLVPDAVVRAAADRLLGDQPPLQESGVSVRLSSWPREDVHPPGHEPHDLQLFLIKTLHGNGFPRISSPRTVRMTRSA